CRMAVTAADAPVSLDPMRPMWRAGRALALPQGARQFLLPAGRLSDPYLGGHHKPPPGAAPAPFHAHLTNPHYLYWPPNRYTVLVSVGATALVARFVGAGDRLLAARAANQAVLLAFVLGVLGTGLGLAFIDPLFALMNLAPETRAIAVGFMTPLLLLLA